MRLLSFAIFTTFVILGATLFQRMDTTPIAKPVPAGMKEILFKDRLFFMDGGVSVDGSEMMSVPCTPDNPSFAYVHLDAAAWGLLTCSSEFMGGVQLLYSDSRGQTRTVHLGQLGEDKEDLWDLRSLVTRNRVGQLVIESLTLASTDNVQNPSSPAACSIQQSRLEWDGRTFVESDASGSLSHSQFNPPINVVNSCLDERGSWKASSN